MVTQNMLRTREGKYVLTNTCDCCRSKQMSIPISLYTCAPISVLPSHTSTMDLPNQSSRIRSGIPTKFCILSMEGGGDNRDNVQGILN